VIPKGLIPLEELFDHEDVAHKPTLQLTEKGVADVQNVATEGKGQIYQFVVIFC